MTGLFGGVVYRPRGRGRGRGLGKEDEPEHFSDTEFENARDDMGDNGEEQPRERGRDPLLEELARSNQQMMEMMKHMMALQLQNMPGGPQGGGGGNNEGEGGSRIGEGSHIHPHTNHMYGQTPRPTMPRFIEELEQDRGTDAFTELIR